jgi:hypothetical protein
MRQRYAKGRRPPVAGRMTKLEARYLEYLEGLKQLGEIHDYRYEPCKLKLADKTWYTPDVLVIDADMVVRFIEVKGHWEDDARVKIKVAARMFPWFSFTAVKGSKTGWVEEHIGPRSSESRSDEPRSAETDEAAGRSGLFTG